MKHLFLSFALSAVCLPALFAQDTTPQTSSPSQAAAIAQGNWIVGGSIGGLGYNFETERFKLEVMPRAGYFISDNAVIGAEASLGLLTSPTVWSYGITPFVRYYFPEGASSTGRWFGEGLIGISGSDADGVDDNQVSLRVGVRAGYAHFIARNVALEGSLGYTYDKADINASSGVSGLGINFGFQIYLPGRANR